MPARLRLATEAAELVAPDAVFQKPYRSAGELPRRIAAAARAAAVSSGVATAVPLPATAELRSLLIMLLTPVSLIGFTFSAWRLAADLRFTRSFIISEGPFSNWMVWFALGSAVLVAANALKRASGRASDS